jgi:hypothetical protein
VIEALDAEHLRTVIVAVGDNDTITKRLRTPHFSRFFFMWQAIYIEYLRSRTVVDGPDVANGTVQRLRERFA